MFRSIVAVLLAASCAQSAQPAPHPVPVSSAPRTLTIIGTSDLHGALDRLPLLAGYIANVRALRAADGGGVIVVDGGDLFQGTLESNLAEGADVVRAYNQIGYAASAIGNHEFDYGPEGPATTAKGPGDDPRGALKARMREAKFPFLASNIVDSASGKRIDWPNAPASVLIDVVGVKVGIVGASTESTPTTTMPANFAGLAIATPAHAIAVEAAALRARGAQVIVAIAHIGSDCHNFDHPDDLSSCDKKDELFRVIDALPRGTIDVFVGGHTHWAVAHRVDGVAAIQAYSSGRAFSRVDLTIVDGKVTASAIAKPQLLCPLDKDGNPVPVADCPPAAYEGRPVVADPVVQTIVDEALRRAGSRRDEKLGVTLTATVTKAYGTESAEGDLMTDLMLEAQPRAQVALTNGGGLRADLPAGELTYGQLFRAIPFDNRFALVALTGKQLSGLVRWNLGRGGGIFSWSGLGAAAHCNGAVLDVAVTVHGKPIVDMQTYEVVTSDFIASGGDGVIGKLHLPPTAIELSDVVIRDAMAEVLRKRRGTIDPDKTYGGAHRRLEFEGKRPLKCSEQEPEEP